MKLASTAAASGPFPDVTSSEVAPSLGPIRSNPTSAVSWPAIFAGTGVAIATSLVLLALGAGLGFSWISPWASDTSSASGLAATAGGVAALAVSWIVVVQWLSAASGGYVTGRLRTRWVSVHTHEVFFRDTAHGFVTWAVASATVAVLGYLTSTSIISGGLRAATAIGSATVQGASQFGKVAPYDIYWLFRSAPGGAAPSAAGEQGPSSDGHAEATRIFANGLSAGGLPDADRSYLAEGIVARIGISQPEAQKRVDEAFARVKDADTKTWQAADAARKTAAATSLITALAMLIGAFVACIAAALGGRQRDLHP
jgi:hypothetical protein